MKTLFSFQTLGSPASRMGVFPEGRWKSFALSATMHVSALGLLLTATVRHASAPPAPTVRQQITTLYAPPVQLRIRRELHRAPVLEPPTPSIKPPIAQPAEAPSVLRRSFVPPQPQARPEQQIQIEEAPQFSALPQEVTVVPPMMAKLPFVRATTRVDFDGAGRPTSRHRQAGSAAADGAADSVFSSGTGPAPAKRVPTGHGGGIADTSTDDLGSALPPAHGGLGELNPVSLELTPVQIIHMPDAVYTEDARKAKIEGTVVVRVLFRADGKLEVLGVLKKLGHGLDEVACSIVEHIDFKPAKRGTIAVDHVTIVGVVFGLAI